MHFLLLTFLTNHIIFDCKLGSCGLCLSNNLGQSHNLLVYCCFLAILEIQDLSWLFSRMLSRFCVLVTGGPLFALFGKT